MKKIKLVDLYSSYLEIKEEFFKRVNETFNQMKLFLGPNVQEFEKKFAEYCGTKFCVGLSSGTDALHLALRACGIKEKDEVLLPSFTFFATLESVWMVQAKPVFVEIDPETFCMDMQDLKRKITKKTKAVISVHLFGHPCDMEPLWELKKKYNFFIIEDGAQAHGARYKNKKVGNLGDICAFSFYYTKNLGALGEAGAITTNNASMFNLVRLMRVHGQRSSYESEIMGFNFRLDEIQAIVLLLKLKKIDEWNKKRKELSNIYRKYLENLPIITVSERDYAYPVYHYFVIRAPKRDRLVEFLKKKGVEVGIHYPIPCHLQAPAKIYGYKKGFLPVTEKISKEVLSLPCHPYLKEEDIDYIAHCIKEFYS